MRKAVIFDLYGTLIDIQTDEQEPWIYGVLAQYLSYYSVRITAEELRKEYQIEIRMALGQSGQAHADIDVYNIFRSIMRRYGKSGPGRNEVMSAAMLFRSLSRKRFGVFQGVYDSLARLSRNYRLAVVSDAQWVFTDPEMEMLGLTRFFRTRILSSRFGYRKPDTRLFEEALKRLWVRPEDSVYIGDNADRDLKGSKGAGMKCLLFRSGSGPYDGLKPDGRFSDYSELEKLVETLLP
ncbi:MAG: HAD family hydrolase [Nitrospiraceae bacterium]|nr:HAD family hydrolase [Nitrospiraceae bacterium]